MIRVAKDRDREQTEYMPHIVVAGESGLVEEKILEQIDDELLAKRRATLRGGVGKESCGGILGNKLGHEARIAPTIV